ncbi:hypothetical protein H312_00268 [Anncaliia algerae PRA339]|uniref:Uncharacterized protein n=1 Tax=Anncaliia algerae PRA339 TaxID=1288291 RepID=A0A059F4W9_9MICR|nr:hypothetical protein H312_00268 [Anncaliia algerae PRA339]
MLSYRFKFTKLKPKDLTYLSIQSFLLALDFASFLKGIRKMLDGFSLTLLKSMNNSGKFPYIQKSEKRIKALLQKTKIYPIGFLYHDWSNEGYRLDIYD